MEAEDYGASGSGAVALVPPPQAAAEVCASSWARDLVLSHEGLLKPILRALRPEDLCAAACSCRQWRRLAATPEFWDEIDLSGRPVDPARVEDMLRLHAGVRSLDARGVALSAERASRVLRHLWRLEVLSLGQHQYCEALLPALASLPMLRTLHLSGLDTVPVPGAPPPPGEPGPLLASATLRELTLENGRATRLTVCAPALELLRLRGFLVVAPVLSGATALRCMEIEDCTKLTEHALSSLLRGDALPGHLGMHAHEEGAATQRLPALRRLVLRRVNSVSDETLHKVAQNHSALEDLVVDGCAAVASPALRPLSSLTSLTLERCEGLQGAAIGESVGWLAALRRLRVAGCGQVAELSLASPALESVTLGGMRLVELDVHCARLTELEFLPPALDPEQPQGGCRTSAPQLRRLAVRSYALGELTLAGLPALRDLDLQCPNLLDLSLSDCPKLPGTALAALGGSSVRACSQLRSLRLSDCDSLSTLALALPGLGELHLSACPALDSLKLSCPALDTLGVDECTSLARLELHSRCLQGLGLGSCPRLESLKLDTPGLVDLDVSGCNELDSLDLRCTSLQSLNATFCGALRAGALVAIARCAALRTLTLAACAGLGSGEDGGRWEELDALSALRRLDLSYTPVEDPAPVLALCGRLTSLALSNNYLMAPSALGALLPASGGCTVAGGAVADASAPLARLIDLDISYCEVSAETIAGVIAHGSVLASLAANGCADDELWPLLHARAGGAAPAPGALRTLSMVRCKALRTLCLGAAPRRAAAAAGLLAEPAGGEDGDEVVALPTSLAGLTELRLGVCSSLRCLVVALPRLEELQLPGCTSLEDVRLACPSLRRLSLQGCVRLGPRGVSALVAACPALEELDLQRAGPGLAGGSAGMEAVRAAAPTLRLLLASPPPTQLVA